MGLEDIYEIQRLAEEIAHITNKQISKEGTKALAAMEPLTYEELDALLETDEYEEYGTVIWVQILPQKCIYAAVLDWFGGEVIAVYGVAVPGCSNQLYGRSYGTEWLAYLERPEFEEE